MIYWFLRLFLTNTSEHNPNISLPPLILQDPERILVQFMAHDSTCSAHVSIANTREATTFGSLLLVSIYYSRFRKEPNYGEDG